MDYLLHVWQELKKIVHRTTKTNDLQQSGLTRCKINKCIITEWTRQWSAQLKNGICPYGLIPSMEPEHLFHNPLPMNNKRNEVGALCDLLTGHSRLLPFQYMIKLTCTPVCTCLADEETAYHYLFMCADYEAARAHTNPSMDNWESVILFLNLTRRLMFWFPSPDDSQGQAITRLYLHWGVTGKAIAYSYKLVLEVWYCGD